MTREEHMLRQVVANMNDCLTWEEFLSLDESIPDAVVRQIANPADVAAALQCWRDLMVAVVDEVVGRHLKAHLKMMEAR